MDEEALAGVKVVDFSRGAAGPLAGTYLAVFGATVVRVESRKRPDLTRVSAPYKDGIVDLDRSGGWMWLNPSKYSITLDLSKPKGLEVAKRLVSWSDVVNVSATPGMMKRLGLDYQELKKVKPNIIMLSSTAQGQEGPYSTLPVWGWSLSGLVGLTNLSGYPDQEGTGPMDGYTDMVVPWFGALAVLAALDYRERTGKGQFIDLSEVESPLHFVSPVLLDYVVNGRVWTRDGNRSVCAAPHGVYRCKGDDRWCAIAVFTDEEWQSLCNVIGSPKWTQDGKFANFSLRKENEDELDKLLEQWTIEHDAEEVMTLMQQARVAAGVVQNAEDLMDKDLHLQARSYVQTLESEGIGSSTICGMPPRLSKTPFKLRSAPHFGEHTYQICTEFLGISNEEFAELVTTGVLE